MRVFMHYEEGLVELLASGVVEKEDIINFIAKDAIKKDQTGWWRSHFECDITHQLSIPDNDISKIVIYCSDVVTQIDLIMRHKEMYNELVDVHVQQDPCNQATKWQPTEDEIRECCGVWVPKHGDVCYLNRKVITQEFLLEHYTSKEQFDKAYTLQGWTKLEPIPEQCIPKPELERERYEWAGIVEEWM